MGFNLDIVALKDSNLPDFFWCHVTASDTCNSSFFLLLFRAIPSSIYYACAIDTSLALVIFSNRRLQAE